MISGIWMSYNGKGDQIHTTITVTRQKKYLQCKQIHRKLPRHNHHNELMRQRADQERDKYRRQLTRYKCILQD